MLNFKNFFDLLRPQGPPTEKLLKFNMSFDDSVKKLLFSKHQNKVKYISAKIIEFKNQNSSVGIFKALATSPVSLTSVASATSLVSIASKA